MGGVSKYLFCIGAANASLDSGLRRKDDREAGMSQNIGTVKLFTKQYTRH